MKQLTLLAFLLLSIFANAQQSVMEQWEAESKTDIRLLPKYGYKVKTEAQKESDKGFIEDILKQDSTHRKGSDHLIGLGFKYLNKSLKTAMYRFNQAYLLDSTNTDIYWGFGAVYMTLGEYEKAEQQYLQGLSIDSTNTHLLTDYATYFMRQYFILRMIEPNDTLDNLNSAIRQLEKSYALNPKDENTTYKLSVCYLNKDNCVKARQYYDECKLLGGAPITEEYTKELEEKSK